MIQFSFLVILGSLGILESNVDPTTLNLGPNPSACQLWIRGVSESKKWFGEIQLSVSSKQHPDLVAVRLPEPLGDGSRSHFKVYDPKQPYGDELGYVMVDRVPRNDGKKGYAYRLMTYSAFDPLFIQEGFAVLPNARSKEKEDVFFPQTEYHDDQGPLLLDVSQYFGAMVPQSTGRSVSVFSTYGKNSADSALAKTLKDYRMESSLTTTPEEISVDDLYGMAGENFDLAAQLPAAIQRLKSGFSNSEIRKGRFGEFEERWFVADGQSKSRGGVQPHRVFFYVIRVGPMSYVYMFDIEQTVVKNAKR